MEVLQQNLRIGRAYRPFEPAELTALLLWASRERERRTSQRLVEQVQASTTLHERQRTIEWHLAASEQSRTVISLVAGLALSGGLAIASLSSTAADASAMPLTSTAVGLQIAAQADAALRQQDIELRSELQQQLQQQLFTARADAALQQQDLELRSELEAQLQSLLPSLELQVASAQ